MGKMLVESLRSGTLQFEQRPQTLRSMQLDQMAAKQDEILNDIQETQNMVEKGFDNIEDGGGIPEDMP